MNLKLVTLVFISTFILFFIAFSCSDEQRKKLTKTIGDTSSKKFNTSQKEEKATKTKFRIISESNYYIKNDFRKKSIIKLLSFKTVYKYNNRGILTKKEGFYEDGSLYYSCKLDSNGNVLEKQLYRSGKAGSKAVYLYDSKSNIIEEQHYYSDGSLFYKDIYKYDSKGNIIEKQHNYSDGLSYKDVYKYNSKGNIIETQAYNSDGSDRFKTVYKYTFDDKDNWIQKDKYSVDENGLEELDHVYERQLEYY